MGLLVLPLVLADLLDQPIDRINIGHGFRLGSGLGDLDIMGTSALGENTLALHRLAVLSNDALDFLSLCKVGTPTVAG